ncbi:unnamed protein product [Bursaphelenchus okinawaensis]|uniref:Uncharacterized protein n=1 Tax=Bursaphelenchus okinawaensis TaxID=465554 RepID=A0A811KH17_9BILA|nr:unnamed protein product [Bursaphelenchus okinawaensis]CAG9103025.1 unnamed protein product [Bursaphelenchus okinawaensis]
MSNKPLVLLFGWAGAQPGQLVRYVKMYEKIGFESIAKIPQSMNNMFSQDPDEADKFYNREFKSIIYDNPRPMVIHTFSVNGCGQLAYIWENLNKDPEGDDIKRTIKGWIADSSPARSGSITQFFKAHFNQICPNKRDIFTLSAITVKELPYIVNNYPKFKLQSLNPEKRRLLIPYNHLMSFPDLPKHQLYLYSTKDTVCSHQHITEFKDFQISKRKQVKWKCWEDSEHCNHLGRHPNEYADTLVLMSRKDPLVFVFGWAKSHPKQLVKYTKIIESLIKIPTSFNDNFWVTPENSEKFYQRSFKPVVHEDRPLIIHTFSNNGAAQFCHIWDRLGQEPNGLEVKDKIKGWIVDSGHTTILRRNNMSFESPYTIYSTRRGNQYQGTNNSSNIFGPHDVRVSSIPTKNTDARSQTTSHLLLSTNQVFRPTSTSTIPILEGRRSL